MNEAHLDFESRSELSIRYVSAYDYANHPSTSIFCAVYKINDQEAKLWIPERAPIPNELWECFKHGIIVAQNATFERAMIRFCITRYDTLTLEQKKWLAEIEPSQFRCTAAKAAACSLPRSLEMASKALGLSTQKDMVGNKLIQKYCKPRKPSKKNPKLWWDDPKDLRRIYQYCFTDVQCEYEIDQELPDLTPQEQKVWELDQKINDRGILIDIPTVKIILKMISEEMINIRAGVRRLSHDTIGEVTQRAKMLKWLNAEGANLPNLKAPTIRDKLLQPNLPPQIRLMLEYRQGGSRTSTAKYLSMVRNVSSDNRARELLLYGGATPTMRWAGKRIQPHNFPRPTIKNFNSDEAIELIKSGGVKAIRAKYGKNRVMDVLVSCVRGMLIASLGKELFCADFAAIEARIAFWVANHVEGIKAFKENRKLYEEMASEAFGLDLSWLCTEEGKNSLERFVGKESVLGCQYGMGWRGFLIQCHAKGMVAVTPEIAKKAVYGYRKLHWPVPKAWRDLENAIIHAIRKPGTTHRVCKSVIYVRNHFLHIKLPSGRKLKYYKPRLSQKQLAGGRLVPQIHYWAIENFQWCETVGWGGIFFNHIVQGIARDLMMNGIEKIEAAEYEFILSVHDEGLAERKIGQGDLREFIGLMTTLPAWAGGAPVTAAGWAGFRYKK